MTDPEEAIAAPGGPDGRLAELTLQIAERLQAGEAVDAEEYAGCDAACVGPIRRLLPTLRDLVAYGRAVNRRRRRDRERSQREATHDDEPREEAVP